MTWIDIRIRKPTEADANENGKVLQLLNDGECSAWRWENIRHTVAWMPIPPFDPPEIPEGWRVVDMAVDKKTDEMKCWAYGHWNTVRSLSNYDPDFLYITPIEPPQPEPPTGYKLVKPPITPEQSRQAMVWYQDHWRGAVLDHDLYAPFICMPIEPQYRPFANASEFKPFAGREWRYKSDHQSIVRPPAVYSDGGHDRGSWEHSLDNKLFCDGQPFGMKVEQ